MIETKSNFSNNNQVLRNLFYGSDEDPYFEKHLDSLFLANSQIIIPFITLLYFISILISKSIMKNVKNPIKIINIIRIYNIFQVIVNILILYDGLSDFQFVSYIFSNLTGENVKNYKMKAKLITSSYFWCLLKASDLLDTLFFILRKKNSHVTFLHIYHHSTTMLIAYFSYRYNPIEQIALAACINSLIHILMYTYYFLCSIGYYPKWKKTVTRLQITQFFIIAFGNFGLSLTQSDPRYFWFSTYLYCQCIMYIYLFLKFYLKTYIEYNKKQK